VHVWHRCRGIPSWSAAERKYSQFFTRPQSMQWALFSRELMISTALQCIIPFISVVGGVSVNRKLDNRWASYREASSANRWISVRTLFDRWIDQKLASRRLLFALEIDVFMSSAERSSNTYFYHHSLTYPEICRSSFHFSIPGAFSCPSVGMCSV